MSANELLDTIRDRLEGPPRHVAVNPRTWRDDLADLISDVAANPEGYGIAAALGFAAGLFVTVGLAWVWTWFL